MDRIIQEHEWGCVSASIAMLADISYIQAVRIVHPFRQSHDRLGSDDGNTIRALKILGFSSRIIQPISLFKLASNAMIFIDHKLYEPDIHACVWNFEDQKVFDPYPRKNRIPSRHLPQSSYQQSTISIIEVKKVK